MIWSSEIRRFVSRIRVLADRDRQPCVVDGLELRITLFVGRSDLRAVSGFVDPLADPTPDASGSERSDASGITSGRCDVSLLYGCNDSDRLTTLLAFLNLNGKNALETLGPRHRASNVNGSALPATPSPSVSAKTIVVRITRFNRNQREGI